MNWVEFPAARGYHAPMGEPPVPDELGNDPRVVIPDAGMVVDIAREELRRIDGERVDLRPQSFQVLRLLALNAGRVVSKSEIHDEVWGDAIVTDDSLVQAIHDLREALGDHDHRMIRTVPRQGYELVAGAVDRRYAVPAAREMPVGPSGSTSAAEGSPTAAGAGAVPPGRGVMWPAAILGLAVVGGLGWLQPWQTDPESVTESLRSNAQVDKPVVAVIPFSNFSDDEAQGHFADGLTEDLITALAKYPDFAVIARNSTFRFKGQSASVQQVRNQLGAHYMVEGSTTLRGNELHVTAQLIDTESGPHVWAERYDSPATDLFAVQNNLVHSISTRLLPPVRRAEKRRALMVPTEELDAYFLYMRARIEKHKLTPESLKKSIELCDQALALDPEFARAHALKAYANGILRVFTGSSPETYEQSLERVQLSLELEPNQSVAYQAMSQILAFAGRYDEAADAGYRGIQINPGDAENHIIFSRAASTAGRYREAVESAELAMKLDPMFPKWYPFIYGRALYADGQYELAATVLSEGFLRQPYLVTGVHGVAALARLGRLDEARKASAEVLEISPKLKLAGAIQHWGFKETSLNDQFATDLKNGGIPE